MTPFFQANTFRWFALTLLLAGCSTTPDKPAVMAPDIESSLSSALENNDSVVNRKKIEVPESLTKDLMALQQPFTPEEPRFDVVAENVKAQQFFKDLASGTGLNIIVDPELSGIINLNLNRVTLSETLNAIRDNYGFDYENTGYGYRIISNRIATRIFTLNYLNVTRTGTSGTGISGSQISDQSSQSSQVSTSYSADFWASLNETLMVIIGDEPGRSVVLNAQTGVIVVRANPEELQAVSSFLKKSEATLQRQVIIEARILEVSLSDGFRSGIDWNSFSNDITRLGTDEAAIQFSGDGIIGVPDLGGIFNLGINSGDFSALIQFLSNQGEVKVLSSPRISTVNNQKAVIKVGTDEYFVTNISTPSDVEDAVPEMTLKPFFSGIALDVTPQIGSNDEIILHVRPSVTEIAEKTKVINIGGKSYQLPLATSSIRETDSIIRASSGQIVIIGGLLQNKGDNQEAGIPVLANIPGFKWLFRQQQRLNEKSELIILLQPKITSNAVWQEEIFSAKERMGQ